MCSLGIGLVQHPLFPPSQLLRETFVPVLHGLHCQFPFLLLSVCVKGGSVDCPNFNFHAWYETICSVFQWGIHIICISVAKILQEFLLKIQRHFCKENSLDLSTYLCMYVGMYACIHLCISLPTHHLLTTQWFAGKYLTIGFSRGRILQFLTFVNFNGIILSPWLISSC